MTRAADDRTTRRKRLVILLVMVGLLIAAAASDPVHDGVRRVLDRAKEIIQEHRYAGMAIFVLLAALSSMVFFFSAAVIVPVGIYAWGPWVTMALLWGGWLLGGLLSYWIGRKPGRRIVSWLIPSRRVKRYENKLAATAGFPLILLFQIAVPSEIPGYVLGALRYRFEKFMAARAVAELPFAVGAVYLGQTFVRRQYLPLAIIAIAGVAGSAIALWFLHRRIDKKS